MPEPRFAAWWATFGERAARAAAVRLAPAARAAARAEFVEAVRQLALSAWGEGDGRPHPYPDPHPPDPAEAH